jgi:glutathionylspermidine synthase
VENDKGLLAVLWEMFPDHELLLPTFFEGDPRAATLTAGFVRKPLLDREGSNIELRRAKGGMPPTAGPYGAEGFVVQALAELPDFSGNRPVIGSWVIAGAAAG